MNVHIDRIAPEGKGLGKAPGSDKLVFVDHALPGEVVEAQALSEKPRFVSARLRRVLEASPSRIDPPCPYHFKVGCGDYCGGCDWQHADYQAQLGLKRDIIADCLRRIGKLEAPVEPALPSPSPWRYRNKVQVPFQASASGPRAGFYVPGSHRIVEFEDCLVQPEAGVRIIRTVKDMARRRGWPAYDEERHKGWLRHLFVRTTSTGRVLVAFVTLAPEFPRQKDAVRELVLLHPEVVSVWQNVQPERTSVILGPQWKKLHGEDQIVERIGPLELESSPEAFLQVNAPAAELLYNTARKLLTDGDFRPRLLLDLYSGVGAIALWLAKDAERVIGIEENPRAVQDAYGNARRAGASNASFVCGRAEQALGRVKGVEAAPWAVVLDPPRAGCEEGVLRFLGKARIERVLYVSCNPATFARDSARLVTWGFRLNFVQPVDLFPQTSHVELVARFDRR